jgi:hypothetical protein
MKTSTSTTASTTRRGDSGEALTKAVAGNVIQKQELARVNPSGVSPTAPSREEAIRHEAYLRAERRGFEPGYELEDWLAAEKDLAEREGAGTVG